jgi:alpha-ketoglutarate-dependent taurine dioxygenase
VHGEPTLYERCFTVTGRPRRDVIRDEFLDSGLASYSAKPAQAHPYKDGAGMLIVAKPGSRLDQLDKQNALKQLSETGFIIFRGFDTDIDAFSVFVQRMSSRVTLDPARSFGGRGTVAQMVDAGLDAVGLHCENGNSPFMPDLCWFFCELAPKAGSQTTVCDGYRVWEALSPETRRAFETQAIVYSRNVDEAKWKRFAFHMLGGLKPLESITVDDLMAQVGDPRNTTVTANADGSIHYRPRMAAAHGTLFGERLSFANSILGPSYHYEKPTIGFEDGGAIPEATLQEIAEVTERFTENIDWCNGDVLLIDNTRVMHGRRAIFDSERRIFNALSYVRADE